MRKVLAKSTAAALLSLVFGNTLVAAAPLKVVSSFSILADMVGQVGGDKVESLVIVGPEGDAHSFEPRPSDSKTLQDADLLIINGAQFEEWLPRLVASAGYKGKVIEAIEGVPLRAYEEEEEHHQESEPHSEDGHHHHEHHHGEYDPHAWQSLDYAQRYVANIQQALAEADPANTAYYEQRAAVYEAQLKTLQANMQEAFGQLPATHRTVVTSHDAFAYLGQDYDIEFLPLLGASNQAEPSAKELAGLIEFMRDNQVKAVFVENTSSPKLLEQIARETGAKVGEVLYSDALAKAPHPAATYLGLMQWNTEALLKALQD